MLLSNLAHEQAVAGFEQAQQQDLERKHALQMHREAEQYALELARIQAQSKAAQPIQAQPLWESGNAFLQHCAASLQKADQPNTQSDSELFEGIACSGFLRGLEEGVSFGVQFAEANTKSASPQPWCMPENGTSVQAGRVLVKYIQAHPETAHQRTVLLALFAYREAFPCQSH